MKYEFTKGGQVKRTKSAQLAALLEKTGWVQVGTDTPTAKPTKSKKEG